MAETGGARRDLGVEGPGPTPAMVFSRWLNFGFFGLWLAAAAVAAVRASVRGEVSALALWLLCAVMLYVFFACWRYFLPQEAWLEGTTLVVHDRIGTRRRNLAAARDYAWGFEFGMRNLIREDSPPVLLGPSAGCLGCPFRASQPEWRGISCLRT